MTISNYVQKDIELIERNINRLLNDQKSTCSQTEFESLVSRVNNLCFNKLYPQKTTEFLTNLFLIQRSKIPNYPYPNDINNFMKFYEKKTEYKFNPNDSSVYLEKLKELAYKYSDQPYFLEVISKLSTFYGNLDKN